MFSINRQRRFAPLLAALLITSTSNAAADGPHLSDVEIDPPAEIGDIASLLHVTKVRGSFQFDGTIKKVALVLEYYKQGKLVPSVPAIKTFMQPVQGGTKGKFSIQIADIDYLQLGDARKNHCRVQIEMGLDQDRMLPREVDIPKYEFDLSQRFTSVPTQWQKDAAAKRPIFKIGRAHV